MHCQACGHENSDDARFCGNCGRETRAQAPAGGQRAQRYSRQTGGGYASSGMREPRPHVPNHLVWAILVMMFCCMPTGIVALLCADQVNRRLDAGDYEGAKRASDSARTWAIVSVALGLTLGLIIGAIWAWAILSSSVIFF